MRRSSRTTPPSGTFSTSPKNAPFGTVGSRPVAAQAGLLSVLHLTACVVVHLVSVFCLLRS
ncbi:hypothetical protein ACFZCP_40025 [Streptomyces sp. NPDC007971]|uniref:hypothetical protein n=1 Tax=Streptomyces sp. NPDC007971 TaxID=3364799 RepID=UPI0036ED87FD